MCLFLRHLLKSPSRVSLQNYPPHSLSLLITNNSIACRFLAVYNTDLFVITYFWQSQNVRLFNLKLSFESISIAPLSDKSVLVQFTTCIKIWPESVFISMTADPLFHIFPVSLCLSHIATQSSSKIKMTEEVVKHMFHAWTEISPVWDRYWQIEKSKT